MIAAGWTGTRGSNDFEPQLWHDVPQIKKLADEIGTHYEGLEPRDGSFALFDYCLLQHYQFGNSFIGPHCDDECPPDQPIAGVSFGEQRQLVMKSLATGEKFDVLLPDR